MATFRVAVMGNQDQGQDVAWFSGEFGVQAFDMTVDQICNLLQDDNLLKALDHTKLGLQPLMTYKVYSGGRFYPTVSREELAQTMQGVQVFIAIVPKYDYYFNWRGQEFIYAMNEANLLDRCQSIVVRIANDLDLDKRMKQRGGKTYSPEDLMKAHGIDPKVFKDRLCVITDLPKKKKSKKASKKKAPTGELQGIERDIASLRLTLAGQEVRETVVQPVKETVTAGKSLLGLGQRLAGWISGLVRAQ